MTRSRRFGPVRATGKSSDIIIFQSHTTQEVYFVRLTLLERFMLWTGYHSLNSLIAVRYEELVQRKIVGDQSK